MEIMVNQFHPIMWILKTHLLMIFLSIMLIFVANTVDRECMTHMVAVNKPQ